MPPRDPPTPPHRPQRPAEPRIRQKANGAFFVRWNGKDHYLSKDPAAAHKLFFDPDSTHPGARAAWLRWKHARSALRSPARSPTGSGQPHAHRPLLVAQLAAEFLASLASGERRQAVHYYTKHLARFVQAHGAARIRDLTTPAPELDRHIAPLVPLLNAFRDGLAMMRPPGVPASAQARLYAPRTINHDLTAIKRLFNWGAEIGRCPQVHFKGARKLAVPRPMPEDLNPLPLFKAFAHAHKTEPLLVPYMALQYLTCARPSEVVQLIIQTRFGPDTGRLPQGRHRRIVPAGLEPMRPYPQGPGLLPIIDEHGRCLSERGLVMLHKHKNSWRSDGCDTRHSGPSRYLVLTDQALIWLDQAVPIWLTLDSYSSAISRAFPSPSGSGSWFGARMLRDSAATHLRQRGVALEDVETLLGHAPRGEWPSYARTPWPRLRDAAARIAV